MLLYFKFAILLATQEIMFVNSGKFSASNLFRPKSKKKQSIPKVKIVDLTEFIEGPQRLSQVLGISDDEIRQSSTTEEPLTPEGEVLLGMLQQLYSNAQKASNRGSQNRNLCCDDNIGTIHCVWLDDDEDCNRILSTRGRNEDTTPPSAQYGTQRRIESPRSSDSWGGNQAELFKGLQRQTIPDEPKPKPVQKPYDSGRTHYSPLPKFQQQEPFDEPAAARSINLNKSFEPSFKRPSSEYPVKPASESQTNFSRLFESDSQRSPVNVAPAPRANPLNKSPPQNSVSGRTIIGPPPGTPPPKLMQGYVIKYKKKGEPHKPVDREEFNRDMLSQHNYFRMKHGIRPFTEDDNLHRSAQKYANELARKDDLSTPHSNWPDLGENLCAFNRRVKRMGLVAVNGWWSELRFCTTYETSESLDKKFLQTPNSIGHLLQLLWKGSTNVGFGLARAASGTYYIVAHYTPQGNIITAITGIGRIGPKTNMLPLQFKQQHINEAKKLADSMNDAYNRGYTTPDDEELNSQEMADDLDTIYDI